MIKTIQIIMTFLFLYLNGYTQDTSYWDEVFKERKTLKVNKPQKKRKHKFWMVHPKVNFKKVDLPEETEIYDYYKPNQHINHNAKKDIKYSDKKLRLQYKKRHRFRVFQPRIAKLFGYQTTLSNRISYTQWKEHNLLSYYDLSAAQFSQKSPNEKNKLTDLRFSFGLQKYLSKRLFIQPEVGMKTFIANETTKIDSKKTFGKEYDPKLQSYLQITLSYQLFKKIPIINRPLRLNGSYTFTNDYEYPVQNLMYKLKDQGLSFGASIQFKI
ncbi:MAG: hypothetical protein COB02_17905 [Candidatus Cloacimonadota bacterium]|nr:MAG: hypothetical protein COB02_17905 [Candidatus Cloacimonadota bacterium]